MINSITYYNTKAYVTYNCLQLLTITIVTIAYNYVTNLQLLTMQYVHYVQYNTITYNTNKYSLLTGLITPLSDLSQANHQGWIGKSKTKSI